MYWFWIRIQNFGPIWIHNFGLIWIQIRIQGYVFNFERNILYNFRIFSQLSLLIVNLCLKSYTFCLYFILYLHVWIRIRIKNTDPYPQSSWIRIQYGSGSNTDPDPQHWFSLRKNFFWELTRVLLQFWPNRKKVHAVHLSQELDCAESGWALSRIMPSQAARCPG